MNRKIRYAVVGLESAYEYQRELKCEYINSKASEKLSDRMISLN